MLYVNCIVIVLIHFTQELLNNFTVVYFPCFARCIDKYKRLKICGNAQFKSKTNIYRQNWMIPGRPSLMPLQMLIQNLCMERKKRILHCGAKIPSSFSSGKNNTLQMNAASKISLLTRENKISPSHRVILFWLCRHESIARHVHWMPAQTTVKNTSLGSRM